MNGSSDKGSVSDSTTTSATATVSETRKIGSTGSPGSPGVLHVIDKSRNRKSKVDRFRGSCWWTRYCPDYSKWVTDCGHEFTAGGVDPENAGPLKPIDAGFEFCCFCGRELVQDYFEPKVDREEEDGEDLGLGDDEDYGDDEGEEEIESEEEGGEESEEESEKDQESGEDDSGVPDDVKRVVMSTAEWINDHAAPPTPETPENLGVLDPPQPDQPSDKLKWKHVDLSEYVDVAIRMVKRPLNLKVDPSATETLPDSTEIMAGEHSTSTTGPPQPAPEPDPEPDVPEKWTVKREDQGYVVGGPYQGVRIPEPPQTQSPIATYISPVHLDTPPGNPPGLTLRDYFAAAVLSGVHVCNDLKNDSLAITAAWSIADMMLSQRDQTSEYCKWLEYVHGVQDRDTFKSSWQMNIPHADDVGGDFREVDIWEKYSWDWKERVKAESGMGEIDPEDPPRKSANLNDADLKKLDELWDSL